MENTYTERCEGNKEAFYHKLISNMLQKGYAVTLPVHGISMLPILVENDMVKIEKKKSYLPGDIVVFEHETEGLLVHRLLKVKGSRYLCKGDNCFRIENKAYEEIYGKVVLISHEGMDKVPVAVSKKQIRLSYKVNRKFVRSGCNVKLTKESFIYNRYKRFYLDSQEDKPFKKVFPHDP